MSDYISVERASDILIISPKTFADHRGKLFGLARHKQKGQSILWHRADINKIADIKFKAKLSYQSALRVAVAFPQLMNQSQVFNVTNDPTIAASLRYGDLRQ